jgi:3-phosphoshikimate 1-carboxyvinyltransferase
VSIHEVKEARGLIGECDAPGSVDISLMALALVAKTSGGSEIRRCSLRPDAIAMVSALKALGVEVKRSKTGVTVTGGALKAVDEVLKVGSSEMFLGCLSGLVAGVDFRTKLDGSANATGVIAALKALGARVDVAVEGTYPLTVGGRDVKAGTHQIDAPDSAVKAAFFLAGLGISEAVRLDQPAAGDDDLESLLTTAEVGFEKSKEVGKEGYHLDLTAAQTPQPVVHDLPGDPDTALYLLGTAAMLQRSELVLHYVGNDWKTRRTLELLRRLNAQLEIQVTHSESKFAIRTVKIRGSELRRTRIGGDQTDLFLNEVPFLAVLGTQAAGETVIRDAEPLRRGPVDRLALVIENLRQMGVKVGEMPDGLVVQGPVKLQGAEVDAGGDAQVGVAFALAGLVAEGETQVVNTGSMAKDYVELFTCLSAVVKQKG